MICNNIEQAWLMCDPTFEEEDPIIPIYEDCDQFLTEENEETRKNLLSQCENINKYKEIKCRNNLLFYYGGMYQSETIWEALANQADSREWLINKCKTFDTFPLRDEEGKQALADALACGSSPPQGLIDLSPIKPSAWEGLNAEIAWEFDLTLSLTGQTT